ncbi:MAG: PHP domain-containing protein [Clostridiales bacterium]|jgi:predicted metal-dependent phosphoesterase TrpH|nr:PHP domain-containing protein [Clostridiales bacterium]
MKNDAGKILFETHLHTAEVSPCGTTPAAEIPAIYKKAGYGGIIVTDHYSDYSFSMIPHSSFAKKIDYYFRIADELRVHAEKIGMRVIFGSEITLNNELWQDFLIYGEIEKPFRQTPYLYNLKQHALHRMCRENGLLMYQAHPFRQGCTLGNLTVLDGLEVYNGNNRDNNAYERSVALCDRYNLMRIAGGDFHSVPSQGRAGIYLPDTVRTGAQLTEALNTGQAALYIKGY